MMATEFMDKLQKLIDDNGDAEINIYKRYTKKTIPINGVFYDDEIKDICIDLWDCMD
jgi:hypothetical protein